MRTSCKTNAGFLTAAGILLLTTVSCTDNSNEDPIERPGEAVTLEFASDFSISENAPGVHAVIRLSGRSAVDGTVWVEVGGDIDACTTMPPAINGLIELDVSAGTDSAFVSVVPINNTEQDGDKLITLKLSDPSGGYRLGARSTATVTIVDDESGGHYVTADFLGGQGEVVENAGEEVLVHITFSESVQSSGQLAIRATGLEQHGVVTNPATNAEGIIVLPVPAGVASVAFTLTVVDDMVLQGHRNLEFEIVHAEGNILVGEHKMFQMQVLDDELAGKVRSYHTGAGGWSAKTSFEYNEEGKVKKEIWESWTSSYRTGTRTYYYSEGGLIDRIEEYPGNYVEFAAENERIVRSYRYSNNINIGYAIYEYDNEGYLTASNEFGYSSAQGGYVLTQVYMYLYHLDGNLYKELAYVPDKDAEDGFRLTGTKTFDHYIDKDNPFPMVQVIPGVVMQRKLPSTYRYQSNGSDLQYQMSYEFGEGDKLITRRVTGGTGNESTTYQYY